MFENNSFLKKAKVGESAPVFMIGMTIFAVSIMLIPCLIASFINHEPIGPFLYPLIFGMMISLSLMTLMRMPKEIKPISGLMMIGVVWISSILFGILPFVMSGMGLVDSIFESASGFTTTGATIMADIESWPTGILLWRSVTNGIGGIITIAIFLLIFPISGYGGRSFFNNELSGSGEKNFTIKVRDAAKQFIIIYSGLIILMIALLLILGISLFESLCMALSAVSTGGFMCNNDSLAGYDTLVKIVATVFMFLGGTNFYLHYKAIYRIEKKPYRKNEEFRVMAAWFLLVSVIVFLVLYGSDLVWDVGKMIDDFVDVALNVVSAGTNTGFASTDYALWPSIALLMIFVITLVGGSAGSTSGGIKISRVIVIVKNLKKMLAKQIYPNAVFDIKCNNSSVDDQGLMSAMSIALLFLMTILIGSVIVILCGESIGDSFALCISCITNFGPATGDFGPMGSCQDLAPIAKLTLSGVMWIGRLEIVAALVLFTPMFWKEVRMSHRFNRHNRIR